MKVKWKKQTEIEYEKILKEKKEKLKKRDFSKLNNKEKDELIKEMAIILGLLEWNTLKTSS